MIKDDTLIQVRNRARGSGGYTLDSGVKRNFEYGEVKKVPFQELRELSYSQGGQYILKNYLVVENEEALELLNMKVEPEYFYDQASIRELLFNKGIDEFADFLDFAPKGAIDMACDMAVKEEVPDTRKREMLSKKTGLNIDTAIQVNNMFKEEEEEAEEPVVKQRRVQSTETKATTGGRRAAAPKYKVVG